jgi:EAL domain-containing protein (putative c-di-GMP-specific phosphodiesterase class I)
VVENFDQPFQLDGGDMMIHTSVGLALAGADEDGIDTTELLRRADIALYAAKTSHVGGVHAFTVEMEAEFFADGVVANHSATDVADARGSAVRLLGELRQALAHGQLTLVYQPKLNLQTLQVVAVEALIRWPHPTRGLLSPDQFMPLVRRHGLSGAVTDHVLNRALDDARLWYDAGFTVPVAVNISPPSLSMRLASTIADALQARELGASTLIVEITEDVVLDGLEHVRLVLNPLRAQGIRIAVDDFGSGYSALSYLRDLPVDHVKLDRHFVAPITSDRDAAVVVRAVVNLAHDLRLTTVAEGIENLETLNRLREFGCDVGQGYYFSPPVPRDRLLVMLADPPWAASSPHPD